MNPVNTLARNPRDGDNGRDARFQRGNCRRQTGPFVSSDVTEVLRVYRIQLLQEIVAEAYVSDRLEIVGSNALLVPEVGSQTVGWQALVWRLDQ